tara:strand:+ start:689 stop:886 length:198 start_codon:yes stop_codon:yes gene_type:complete
LLNDVGDVLQLGELVPVVVREHAFGANDGVAEFAEILYLFVLMLEAEYFSCAGLGDGNLWNLAAN